MNIYNFQYNIFYLKLRINKNNIKLIDKNCLMIRNNVLIIKKIKGVFVRKSSHEIDKVIERFLQKSIKNSKFNFTLQF